MSFIQKLKTTAASRDDVKQNPIEGAREKIMEAAHQQITLVQALIAREEAPTKTVVKYRDGADGSRERYEEEAKIKPWFWGDGRKWYVEPRYANRPLLTILGLENAVSFTKLEQIVEWLGQFNKAVADGEFDQALEKARQKNRKS